MEYEELAVIGITGSTHQDLENSRELFLKHFPAFEIAPVQK